MTVQMTGNSIIYSDGSSTGTDPLRLLTVSNLPVELDGSSDTNTTWSATGHWYSWSVYGPNYTRGRLYNNAFYYTSSDSYGQYGTTSATRYLEIRNWSSTSTLRVTVTHGIVEMSDDNSQWKVYRDGTATNTYTHSGGTLLYDSGVAARTNGVNSATLTNDIAPSATALYYLYAGITSGSSGDALRGILKVSYNAWV